MSINNIDSHSFGFLARAKKGKLKNAIDGRFFVNSTIVDRMSGISHSYEIFSGTINSHFVSERLAKTKVRETVSTFFTTRAIAPVIEDVIGARTHRIGGPATNRSKLYSAIKKSVADASAADVIMEMIMPVILKVGLVRVRRPIHTRVSYPYADVKLSDLLLDFERQVVVQAVQDCTSMISMAAGETWASAAIGEEMADAFFAMGTALRTVKDFDMVANDIVRGVRAKIDPELTGLKGDVPEYVREHDVVATLSQNLIFVDSALDIKPGTSVRIMSDGYKFDKWAPTVLVMLRTSERYSVIGRAEYLENIGVRVVRDSRGIIHRAIVWEAAKMASVAMSVDVAPDISFPGALSIDVSNERLGEHVEASYDRLPETLSTTSCVMAYSDVLRDVVETLTGSKKQIESGLEFYSISNSKSIGTVAMMMSDSIGFKLGEVNEVVYRCKTNELTFDVLSGSMVAGEVFTTDPVELIMLVGERDAKTWVEPKPQLINRTALKSSMVGVDEKLDFISMSERFSFKSTILGVPIQGSLRAAELQSMEVPSIVSLVRPVFNTEVLATSNAIIEQMYALREVAEDELVKSRIRRSVAEFVLTAAQGVSASFRDDIHAALIERSIAMLDPETAMRTRSRIGQRSIGAVADIVGAVFFMGMQGLIPIFGRFKGDDVTDKKADEAGSVIGRPLFLRLMADEDVVREWAEEGTDRAGKTGGR